MHRNKFLVLALVVGFVGIVGGGLVLRDKDEPEVKGTTNTASVITSDKIGMTVEREPSLSQTAGSQADEAQGQLWKLTQPAGSRPEFAIDANYQQGESIKKLASLTRQPLKEAVVANVNLQLPKQFPEFKEITQRNLTINDTEANETIFEYTTSGVRVKQRLMLYFKNSDTVIYIRAQVKSTDYDAINPKYFDPIFSSVKFK